MLVAKKVSKYHNSVFFFNWVELAEGFQLFNFPSKSIEANTACYLLSSLFLPKSQTCSVREGRLS